MDVPFCSIYEDNHVIVVCKPAGIPTQESPEHPVSLQGLVKKLLKEKYRKPGNVFCEPIHRIDKPVSGIVVCAKTSKALSRLLASIRDGLVSKHYIAKCAPMPGKQQDTLVHYLMHGDHRALIVDRNAPGAKRSELRYIVNGESLEIELITGRYHQIRAQLAAIGCPIIGDARYGSKVPFTAEGIALHHARFAFPHPVSKELITVSSAPDW